MFDWLKNLFRKETPSPHGGDLRNQPVHAAARENCAELRRLLETDPGLLELPGHFGSRPLHFAAEAGRGDCVEELLQRGADPDARDLLHRWVPLHQAVDADSIECVRLLLGAGAEVNAADERGETPLFYCRSRAVIELLVEAGATLDLYSDRGQYAVEYCSAYVGSMEVMDFWIERGILPNRVPEFGWPTAMGVVHRIARGHGDRAENLSILAALLKYGADPNVRDKQGQTCLHMAVWAQDKNLVRSLLDAGANPNLGNAAGETALHIAASRESRDLVVLLIQRGANVNAVSLHGDTPCDIVEKDSELRDLLKPTVDPAPKLPPTRAKVLERFRAIPRFRNVHMCGCSEQEIEDLESRCGVKLPESYRQFLRTMGHGAGDFLLSDHFEFLYEQLPGLARDDDYLEEFKLPDDYFVFAQRLGGIFLFFRTSEGDDPPVYCFGDHTGDTYEPFSQTVWEWVEKLVIDYEIWSRMGIGE